MSRLGNVFWKNKTLCKIRTLFIPYFPASFIPWTQSGDSVYVKLTDVHFLQHLSVYAFIQRNGLVRLVDLNAPPETVSRGQQTGQESFVVTLCNAATVALLLATGLAVKNATDGALLMYTNTHESMLARVRSAVH